MMQLVQFSTGIGSAEVARRVVVEHGPAAVTVLTANTLVEDDDDWRFAREAWQLLDEPEWLILSDGRTPMQVGRDRRVVPNNRMAVCSRILKRELLRAHIERTYQPGEVTIHLGYDWAEIDRYEAAIPHWQGWHVDAILTRPPYVNKPDLLDEWRSYGIEPPRLYRQGFPHANCGGACVRGGQAQWELLLRVNRSRYLEWESEENRSRETLGKDVSILRDRTGGRLRPLTLSRFREQLEAQPGLFDPDDWGACGCTDDFGGAV